MSEITIVTAYFDIGRNNWKGFERGTNKYINYFKFWARIQNKVIIYTSPQFVDEIFEIRKQFGLEDKTKIIAIDNMINFDKDLYHKINKVMDNDISLLFHKEPHRPEAWSGDYNYIMMLKSYCIVDAIKNEYASGMIAWMDFGYNHGGKDGLIKEEEFNFLWKYEFSSKMHVFTEQKLDLERPIFDIVRSMDVYIRGNLMIAPDFLWEKFNYLSKQAMMSLLYCGLCDDDQTITLMVVYEYPNIFEIHDVAFWYSGLKGFGGAHFTVQKDSIPKIKKYRLHKDKARMLFVNGKYKLAFNEYKQYTKERIMSKLKK